MAVRSLLLAMHALLVLKTSECEQPFERVVTVSTNCLDYSLEPQRQWSGSGCEACVELSEALGSLDSYVTLELEPGTHYLRGGGAPVLAGLHRVAIRGTQGSNGGVSITCEDHIGLAFVNITGLTIADVTVHRCGLSHDPLNMSLQVLEETTQLSYRVPTEVKIAVLIGDCRDVRFHSVTVTNTTGLGVLAVNILGESSFENLTVTDNTRLSCELDRQLTPTDRDAYKEVGGGVIFIYQDRDTTGQGSLSQRSKDSGAHDRKDTVITQDILTITGSTFSRNAGCSNVAKTSTVSGLFEDDNSHLLGGGGGLSVFLKQTTFWVVVTVEDTTFRHNDAKEGGGAYIGIVSGVEGSSVNFIGCVFENNGQSSIDARSKIAESACINGAGLVIKTDISEHDALQAHHWVHDPKLAPIVRVMGTNFSGNAALRHGGGLVADSAQNAPNMLQLSKHFPTKWLLEGCFFDGNMAGHGSAGYFYQSSGAHQEDSITLLTLTDIHMTRSMLQMALGESATPLSSSGMDIVNMKVTVQGRFTCTDNAVTALYIRSSDVNVHEGARVLFRRNSGYLGGGVCMEGEFPAIRLGRYSSVVFDSNMATIKGGGMYVSATVTHAQALRNTLLSYSSCFLFPPLIGNSSHHFNLSRQLSHMQFTNNMAPIGAAVYGSTLAACPWARALRQSEMNVYQALHDIAGFMELDSYPYSARDVSTLPVRMSVSVDSSARTDGRIVSLYPGQMVPLHITIYDDLGQLIPSIVQSTTFDDPSATARLGRTGIQLVDFSNTSLLTVTGQENHTFNVTLLELLSIISVKLTITLLPCSVGYVYNTSTKTCDCNKILLENGVTCNARNLEELVLPPSMWVGILEHVPDISSAPLQGITTEDLVINECPLRYCNGTNTTTVLPHSDAICAVGSMKSGVLCGQCVANHSAVLGRYNKCAKCSNVWLALIPVLGVSGILLFVAIAFLQLTVDKGWMYVVIFYCNTVTLYAYFLPVFSPLHFVLIPVHLVSLQIGYEVCFYDGMTTLAHVWLQLVFPAYLYLLMVLFVLLSRRSSWLSQHFSPTQTLLTLFVMSYTSILETCISSIYGIKLSTLSGDVSTLRWQADAHVEYFTGWHAALVVVSMLLLVFYIIPLPVLMLFPVMSYRHTNRFKPFFDAMWAPFETKLRFWLGMRFLVLITIYLIAYMSNVSNFSILSFSATLLIFNQIQTSIKPFKSKWINRIDGFLTMTIVLLLALTYQSGSNEDYSGQKMSSTIKLALECVCFGLAYVVVLLALLCSSTSRFTNKTRAKCSVFLRACCLKAKKRILQRRGKENSASDLEMRDLAAPPTTNSFRVHFYPRVRGTTSFSQLRETLLDTPSIAARND